MGSGDVTMTVGETGAGKGFIVTADRPKFVVVMYDPTSDEFASDVSEQVAGAIRDFWNQYWTMREEWVKGNDHYNHAMANSKATRRGPFGKATATAISYAREITDFITGDSWLDWQEDQRANRHGRAIPFGVNPEDWNKIYDTRRGGEREKIDPNSINNFNIIDVLTLPLKFWW